jgi:hypothetical protein
LCENEPGCNGSNEWTTFRIEVACIAGLGKDKKRLAITEQTEYKNLKTTNEPLKRV